ncbi:MAG: CDP-glucose 4,6-dehydratase [Eubacteriales bacterium]
MDLSFYKGKTVFVTGHTGFKGSWLCSLLLELGAKVIGYALEPNTTPNLFTLLKLEEKITHIQGDIRDYENIHHAISTYQPEIVLHLAAQPLVRESYENPVYTYETNVMGTVNLCEAIRNTTSVKSFLNVTTDKVYENKEWHWGYRENEPLNGFDPYSNSKSCSELVTSSYINSFFKEKNIPVSTARAGNVIGGGDFSADRIIPDCVRAMEEKKDICIRNPHSTRPYQHVLEPICAYLMIAQEQYLDSTKAGHYNVGPEDTDCVTTGTLVALFCKKWGESATWKNISLENQPHEANFLKLDCSKLKYTFDWHPKWTIEEALSYTVDWSKVYLEQGDLEDVTRRQIQEYLIESES